MKKFIPLLLIFLVSSAVIAWYQADRESVITITDSGFSPTSLRVKQGALITFKNLSNHPSWIASSAHPTHEDYPEFDSGKAVQPGDSWKFKVDRGGSFTYHDHINPEFTGTITVIGGEKRSNDKQNLLIKIDSIIQSEGAEDAYLYLVKTYPSTYSYGHDMAHYLGKLIYKEKGISGLKICDTAFGFGCYHGFIQDYIADMGPNQIPALSDECLKRDTPYGQLGCHHGIGHGVLSHYKYDVKKSLSICDKYLTGDFLHTCYTGIFMENPNDSVELCKSIENRYKSACYEYIHEGELLSSPPVVVSNLIKKCESAESEYVPSCYKSIGGYVGQVTRVSNLQAREYCGLADNTDNEYTCFQSVSEVWRLYEVEDKNIEELCDYVFENLGRKCEQRRFDF